MKHAQDGATSGLPENDAAPGATGAGVSKSSVHQNTTADRVATYSIALFEPDDIVEVRALRGKGEARSEWCVAKEAASG